MHCSLVPVQAEQLSYCLNADMTKEAGLPRSPVTSSVSPSSEAACSGNDCASPTLNKVCTWHVLYGTSSGSPVTIIQLRDPSVMRMLLWQNAELSVCLQEPDCDVHLQCRGLWSL